MRLTRERGTTGPRRAVEAAHFLKYQEDRPYYEIAVGIFGDPRYRTAALVKAQIAARYEVEISEKTASDWINRGIAAREAAEGAEGAGGAPGADSAPGAEEREPAGEAAAA